MLDKALIGRTYKVLAKYGGETVYLSAESDGGQDLIVVASELLTGYFVVSYLLPILPLVMVCVFVYFPLLSLLCAKVVLWRKERGIVEERRGDANTVLEVAKGYIVFLSALAIFAYLFNSKKHWPAFTFVFLNEWSNGIHLFSLWAALFTISLGVCIISLLHTVLGLFDDQISPRARTLVRLAYSLITYVGVILIAGLVLTMFGVDTAALLASAGIVSIAVGMGSRELVTDILAGLFMIFEGAVHVGDDVVIGGWKGRVTDMGIRTTEITNEEGDVKILNNSRISDVVNMSRKNKGIPEEEDAKD